jgi:hypothetical protein
MRKLTLLVVGCALALGFVANASAQTVVKAGGAVAPTFTLEHPECTVPRVTSGYGCAFFDQSTKTIKTVQYVTNHDTGAVDGKPCPQKTCGSFILCPSPDGEVNISIHPPSGGMVISGTGLLSRHYQTPNGLAFDASETDQLVAVPFATPHVYVFGAATLVAVGFEFRLGPPKKVVKKPKIVPAKPVYSDGTSKTTT